MTYEEYLEFYRLKETKETYTSWLYNEWHHGRVYQYEGNFYTTETGKKHYYDNKSMPLEEQINSAVSKIGKSTSDLRENNRTKSR